MSDPTPVQQWAPPKNPLPPHRLARLANALGVSTPLPAIHAPPPILSPSYNGSNTTLDQYRRSPTPSTATSFAFASSSKYLLHVIPPVNLPHDSDAFDSDLTPPPSTASGYHTHFRRGTLVPFHPTLQSQLGAIAKEYALPSTTGLVLYLVSQSSEKPKQYPEEDEPPGPRLSEEVWRHLWARVAKSESRDEGLAPPLLGLGLGVAGRSSPYLHQSSAYPLPLISTNGTVGSSALHPQPTYPFTPSPTTPSSTSDIPRFNTKSAPPSSSSRSISDADGDGEAETPATSRADSLDLPGLGNDSLIPILAKVEFDIDRRRAGWYDPWVRSRRMNHAKRARTTSETGAGSSADDAERRTAPLPFKLKGKRNSIPDSLAAARARYLPFSESPQSMNESDSDADDEDTDARGGPRPHNPHLEGEHSDDSEFVEMIGRPNLGVDIPAMSNRSSPSRRRGPPTPLILHRPPSDATPVARIPSLAPDSDSDGATPPTDEEGRTILPYLDSEHDPSSEERSRKAPDRREGGFYDDMDIGFSSDDLDNDDPNDRRKSQFIMRAQLDEIEKNLAQFSPRQLKTELLEDSQKLTLAQIATSPTLSPPRFSPQSAISPSEVFRALSNADVFPPTPRLPEDPDKPKESDSEEDLSHQAAWPAVPFSSLVERPPTNEQSPPQLAVNGVSASVPKRFRAGTNSSGTTNAPSETEVRKRELAEEQPSTAYPAMTPSIGNKSSLNSPLIPLSPDPFGRSSSSATAPPGSRTSGAYWESPVVIPASPEPPVNVKRKSSEKSVSDKSSSRFSTDSINGVANSDASSLAAKQSNRTTIMSVKGIKNLWRKSQKNSVSIPKDRSIPAVPENPFSPLAPPSRPNRPSMEEMQFPDVDVPVPRTPLTPSFGQQQPPPSPRISPRPSPRPSMDQPPLPTRRPSQTLDQIAPISRTPPPQAAVVPPQLVPPQRRPSQDELRMQHIGQPPPQLMPPRAPTHPALSNMGMNRPPPMLQSANSAPIVAAKAGPPRRPFGDELHWDQESPYPTRMTPMRAPSVTSSVPSRPPSAASTHPSSSPSPAPTATTPPPMPASPPPPPGSEKDKARKSILKLKPATNGAAVPAPLTPSASTFRASLAGRRPSWSQTSSSPPTQNSPLVFPPDIPPSPKLPEQFVKLAGASQPSQQQQSSRTRPNSAAIMRRRLSAKMSTDSTRRHRTQGSTVSIAQSHTSEDTHESTSLDTSGFEIVSPKMGGALNFPYTEHIS
ncbi:hypothetical protein MIND_00534500 [Mycena indigotica]|uniref:Uncharacterized protein n=1 Tax=Mycena indigotica TaxID=2126181 RepID=A0A8H6SY29_9AGAR|nr:uncharacterized protein MIND_00534500 [Mycena indigotica]KAF7307403.1 hypothetical protein MIND_00534500 [Mycena indigotica]